MPLASAPRLQFPISGMEGGVGCPRGAPAGNLHAEPRYNPRAGIDASPTDNPQPPCLSCSCVWIHCGFVNKRTSHKVSQ